LFATCLFQSAVNAEDKIKPESHKPAPAVLAMFKLGCGDWESKAFADGERHMTSVIAMDPKFARPYYVRACCRHMQHNYEGALSDCNTCIAIEPNGNPIFYFERAITEYRLKQLDPCIKDCDIALKRAPTFPGSYLYRANAKSGKGDREGALRDCEAYLRARPANEQGLKLKQRLLSGW